MASPLVGRSRWGAVLGVVLLVLVWWFTADEDESPAGNDGAHSANVGEPSPSPTQESTSVSPSAETRSPAQTRPTPSRSSVDAHGLRWVDASDLPDPAAEVLAAIDAGGPFEHAPKDGSTFGNHEGVLPKRERGYYREYTVETPGVNHRGTRRIVTGRSGEFYWTSDHYESFSRIRR